MTQRPDNYATITPKPSHSLPRLSDTRKVRTRHGARWGAGPPTRSLLDGLAASGGASCGMLLQVPSECPLPIPIFTTIHHE